MTMQGNVWPGASNKGGGVGSAIGSAIAGSVANAVSAHVSSRGHERMARATADLHRSVTDDSIRFMGAAAGHGPLQNIHTAGGSASFFEKHDNQNTGEPSLKDTMKSAAGTRVGHGQLVNVGAPKMAATTKSPGKAEQAPASAAPTAGGTPTRRAPMALENKREATVTLNPKEAHPSPAAPTRMALGSSLKGPGEFPHPMDVAKAVRGKKIGAETADALHPGWKDTK